DVPRGTFTRGYAHGMFHVEHSTQLWETALPRCSTWNIRRTDQAVDRARASKAESEMFHVEHSTGSQSSTLPPSAPAMFHVEHSRVAMPMGCSTWNIFRGANPDVPR